jgi:hypothetical protein
LEELSAERFTDKNAFAFVSFALLGLSYIGGQVLAPLGRLVDLHQFHRKGHTRPVDRVTWRRYDWLRVHLPDAGALAARIRAEYTMCNGIAAALGIGVAVRIVAAGLLGLHFSRLTWPTLVAIGGLMAYRGWDVQRTFGMSVDNLYTVATSRDVPIGRVTVAPDVEVK